MTTYLERDIAADGGITCGCPLIVADEGMLQSAVARPNVSAFGEDVYPMLEGEAVALLHSLRA